MDIDEETYNMNWDRIFKDIDKKDMDLSDKKYKTKTKTK